MLGGAVLHRCLNRESSSGGLLSCYRVMGSFDGGVGVNRYRFTFAPCTNDENVNCTWEGRFLRAHWGVWVTVASSAGQ